MVTAGLPCGVLHTSHPNAVIARDCNVLAAVSILNINHHLKSKGHHSHMCRSSLHFLKNEVTEFTYL